MEVIARVRSEDPAKPLSQLLDNPLDLDLWEIRPDSLVLRAEESVTDQLRQLGYAVELLEETTAHLATFATEAALAMYHSAATLEQDLRVLAEREPEIAELHEYALVVRIARHVAVTVIDLDDLAVAEAFLRVRDHA